MDERPSLEAIVLYLDPSGIRHVYPHGRETLRACIVHPDTGPEHLAILVAEAVAAARSLV